MQYTWCFKKEGIIEVKVQKIIQIVCTENSIQIRQEGLIYIKEERVKW